jgi:hypothetical protein
MTNRFNQLLVALAYCMLGLLPSINAFAANVGACQQIGAPVCIDGPSTRNISGHDVYRDCWNYQSQYNCVNQTNTTDTCTALVSRGCGQIGSTCVDYLPDGVTCDMYERTYQCQSAPGTTSTQTNCGGQVYCMDGHCMDTSYAPDHDFAKAAVAMEIARESGTYLDPNTMKLFSGKGSSCRVTLSSFNCCRSDTHGAASRNDNVALQLGIRVVSQVGSEAIKYVGSTYMYDALFNADAPGWLLQGFSVLTDTASGRSYQFSGPSLSYFGLTIGYGTAPTGAGTTLLVGNAAAVAAADAASLAATAAAAADTAVAASLASGSAASIAAADAAVVASAAAGEAAATAATAAAANPGFYLSFGVVGFIIAIVVLIYSYLSSCTMDEQTLAMKNGQNLCTQVGRYCSSKVLGSCVQTTQAFCCYNSELAKIIEAGAHQQLGLSWGDPHSPDCSGLTVAQIALIDFSQIDFTAFIAHIEPSVKTPGYATGRATTLINNYYHAP